MRARFSRALQDAGIDASVPQALYVGNMMSGMLSQQQHLGPLLANAAGLENVEAATIEACCGAGGAALRWGYMAIMSGIYHTVVVAGAEQMTHTDTPRATQGLATASHWETEGSQGATFVSLNGILMDLYMKQYGVRHEDFAPFALTAHSNALTAGERARARARAPGALAPRAATEARAPETVWHAARAAARSARTGGSAPPTSTPRRPAGMRPPRRCRARDA